MILQPSIPCKRRPARQHGAAVIEFALILALLISLLAGIFEFGRAFWYYDALTKATRDGARAMSVSATADIASVGVGLAKKEVADAVTAAGVPDFTEGNVAVTCLNDAFDDAACTDGATPGGVRVQIVGYTMSIGQFIPFLIGASSSYSATLSPHTTMRYMLPVL
ncbi:TadE/TadG family type IV pilus assembly protein [Noviherbaspirillum sedimenti]|uniref:Pilus assembly protein n=1 Tax=Noviherbaspirillum sedimenti TaxID=2320865 RepID=A0A3A3G823_9BURK|nr:TadE/TadG family type IV pilus assembly protein [Noviherbaspirillum sedimenti]RJG04568.1 pilus assembly protein [Noviherbaspirillum sedimenti]